MKSNQNVYVPLSPVTIQEEAFAKHIMPTSRKGGGGGGVDGANNSQRRARLRSH